MREIEERYSIAVKCQSNRDSIWPYLQVVATLATSIASLATTGWQLPTLVRTQLCTLVPHSMAVLGHHWAELCSCGKPSSFLYCHKFFLLSRKLFSSLLWCSVPAGVIARHPDFLPYIRRALTTDVIRNYFGHFLEDTSTIERHVWHWGEYVCNSYSTRAIDHSPRAAPISNWPAK